MNVWKLAGALQVDRNNIREQLKDNEDIPTLITRPNS
jgi:hypothetical protein